MAERTLKVTIVGDSKDAQKALNGLANTGDDTQKKMAGVGTKLKGVAVGIAASFAAAGTVEFFKGGVESLQRIERIGAQTNAVLKSTGGAAGVTAKEIESLANSIEKKTSIEAEAVQEGQNLLLTFTNLQNKAGAGNDIFNQATKIMTDMSVALGTDAKGSAIQLGKALNDPIKGISALTRVGVTFTEEQKAQIKTMVEAGDTMGAQKIILAELNKEFGGSADALGDTLQGRMQKVKNEFGNIQEKLVAALIPALTKLAEMLLATIEWFSKLNPGVQKAIGVVAGLAAGIVVLSQVVKAFTAVQAALNVVLALNPIGLVVIAIAALTAAFVLAWQHSEKFRQVVEGALKGVVNFALGFVEDFLGAMVHAFGWIPGIGPKLKQAQKEFQDFRDDVNRSLDGIHDKTITIRTRSPGDLGRTLAREDRVRGFAKGGAIAAGGTYLVGELGPELITPSRSGYVVPNDQLSLANPAGSSGTVINHFHFPNYVGDKRELVDIVAEGLRKQARQNGRPITV